MITKTRAYTSSDGHVHATLAGAQRAELLAMFTATCSDGSAWTGEAIINTIFDNADKIKDVLTTSVRSRPGARAVNGATRKPKSKPPVAKSARAAHVAGDYAKMRAEVDAVRPAHADAV